MVEDRHKENLVVGMITELCIWNRIEYADRNVILRPQRLCDQQHCIFPSLRKQESLLKCSCNGILSINRGGRVSPPVRIPLSSGISKDGWLASIIRESLFRSTVDNKMTKYTARCINGIALNKNSDMKRRTLFGTVAVRSCEDTLVPRWDEESSAMDSAGKGKLCL